MNPGIILLVLTTVAIFLVIRVSYLPNKNEKKAQVLLSLSAVATFISYAAISKDTNGDPIAFTTFLVSFIALCLANNKKAYKISSSIFYLFAILSIVSANKDFLFNLIT